jgi:hypothetical protein
MNTHNMLTFSFYKYTIDVWPFIVPSGKSQYIVVAVVIEERGGASRFGLLTNSFVKNPTHQVMKGLTLTLLNALSCYRVQAYYFSTRTKFTKRSKVATRFLIKFCRLTLRKGLEMKMWAIPCSSFFFVPLSFC